MKSITVKADGQGTFKQNVTNANVEHPFWEAQTANTSYAVLSKANAGESIPVTSSAKSIGTEAILLPQNFNTGKTVITIEYYITNDDETPLLQTATFDLNSSGYDATETENGTPTSVTVIAWEMGKKYTYNIVFSLNDIYFAPSVTDWVDVSSEDFGI